MIDLSDRDYKTNMYKWLMTQISLPKVLYTSHIKKYAYEIKIHGELSIKLDTVNEKRLNGSCEECEGVIQNVTQEI